MVDRTDQHRAHEGKEPFWRCPEPKQLPELRGKLSDWLAEQGKAFYMGALQVGTQQIRPPGPLPTSALQLANDEHRRVTGGDLYWVSQEMTELAQHAGRQFRHHELYEHDLPSRTGFMIFQTPLAATDQTGITLEIVAVSWGIVSPRLLLCTRQGEIPIGDDWANAAAVWFTFYSHPETFLAANVPPSPSADDPRALLKQYVGPFMPDNELIWPLGQPEDLPEPKDTTGAWGQTVVAAWLLMRQPLATRSSERPPRPARRRLQRAGLPSGDIQLIHIRRPQRRPNVRHPQPGRRDYSVRWWVEGHWRRYHTGPGRTRLERRWINPYLAGPDDKPIRGAHRVKVWDR
jgi:hypothetical protein